jgi:hypothetical protein
LFSNSFTFSALPCRLTPTGEFVLRQLLNRDEMNKLSQLSVYVSFTIRVTCLDSFSYMLPRFPYSQSGAPPMFSGPISRHYSNRRTWEACSIDCMKILGNIYRNRFRHVTRRVKLTETLNWKNLFIPSRLSSCRSTNSPVGVNPHGSAEKAKLLLNSSLLKP